MPTDVVILYPGVCRGLKCPHVHFWICVSNVGVLCSFTGLGFLRPRIANEQVWNAYVFLCKIAN